MDYQPTFGFDDRSQYDDSKENIVGGILASVRRSKFLAAGIALLIIVAGVLMLSLVSKSYTATGSIIVDPVGPEAVNLSRVLPEAPLEHDTLASEVEILNSRALLQKVVVELNLVSNPEFNPNLQSSFLSRASDAIAELKTRWLPIGTSANDTVPEADKELDDTIHMVGSHLSIDQVGQSRVIRISYSSHDPEMAAQVANALIRDYMAEHVHLREAANAKAHNWIVQRLNDLSVRAADSARAAENYRASHGLTRGRDTTLLQEEITQVNSQLSAAREQRDEAVSAIQNSSGPQSTTRNWDQLSAVLNSPLIEKLREQESLANQRRAQLQSKYGSRSPMLNPVNAEIAGLKQTINTEIAKIGRSLVDKVTAAQANEAALNARLSSLKTQIAKMDEDLVPMQKLERQAVVDRDLYTTFLSRSKETDPWLEYPAARIRPLSMAATPVRPSFPNTMIALPLIVVMALALATIAAVVVDSRRLGFLSTGDVDRLMGVPSLGLIPLGGRGDVSKSNAFREAISLLFVRVARAPDSQPRSVLVTSAVPGEGKTTTALALAREGAARGLNVLLIDGDLRSRGLSTNDWRSDGGSAGLAEVLRGEIGLDRAIKHSAAMGVSFLSAGRPSDSPARLLGLASLRTALWTVKEHFDLVVIDSPPVLIGADTWLLGQNADATILLARWRHTSVKSALMALKFLAVGQTKLAGVVLSMVNIRKNAQYDHGDSILFSAAMQRYYNQPTAIAYQRPAGAPSARGQRA